MQNILDKKQALEQAGGNATLARELFDMLLQELPELHRQLEQAIARADTRAMWDHAHKIYGSTAYCGVPALREAAQRMETCLKQPSQGDQLTSCFQQLSAEIERLLEQGPHLAAEAWEG